MGKIKPKHKHNKDVKPVKQIKKFERPNAQKNEDEEIDLVALAEEAPTNSVVAIRARELGKLDPEKAKHGIAKQRLEKRKKRLAEGVKLAADAEVLNTEEPGFLQMEDDTPTFNVKQAEITSAIDMATAARSFSLDLDFGPYRFDYGINGRELIIGGRRGHVGVFDWMTKDLLTEKDMLEAVNDVSFLHVSTIFAAAQKRWVHIYDEQGTELHCMKKFNEPKLLEFLPRHLLLVSTTATGYIHYLDISTGEVVASFRMKEEGNPQCIKKNETNGILLSGGPSGNVCMWSPNVKESIVTVKAHTGLIKGLAVDHSGNYFATASTDQRVKIFDIRNYKQLHVANIFGQISSIDVSQRDCLAVGTGQKVLIYENVITNGIHKPYLNHFVGGDIRQVEFCAHEDVLGIGHSKGFASIIVPGSGDPDMAGLIHNPFESKNQRREREVRMLLDKLQPEMICVDPSELNRVRRQKEIVQELPQEMKVKPDPGWALLSRFRKK
ncbi:hypothetical protein FO519_009710 [Halicephalobus sp. NKZ332]|nr:hypothetical protein FO519_009710 [Halicephalobus sp. NKZ332]